MMRRAARFATWTRRSGVVARSTGTARPAAAKGRAEAVVTMAGRKRTTAKMAAATNLCFMLSMGVSQHP
jgi:hypothetical protein